MNLIDTTAALADSDKVDQNFLIVKSEIYDIADRVLTIETNGAGGNVVSVKNYGAVGDGVTDDTVAIQAALNAMTAGSSLEFEAGHTYAVTNLSIPNTTNDWRRNRIYSNGTATIKRIAGGDASYMIASERWLPGSAGAVWANSPVSWENIIFNASKLCDYALANKSYGSEFIRCDFDNAIKDGLLFTRKNSDGSLGTTAYLSNTRIVSCGGSGNGGYWLRTQGTAANDSDSPTDGHILSSEVDCTGGAGCVYLANAGGWMIRGNHTFAYTSAPATNAELFIAKMENPGAISDNIFEGLVRIGGIGNQSASIGPGNNFWEGVRVDFTADSSVETISILGNTFSRSILGVPAVITHGNNSSLKTIVSSNVFQSPSPHIFAPGVTAGSYVVLNAVANSAPITWTDRLSQYWKVASNIQALAVSGFRDIRATSGANHMAIGVDGNNAYVATYSNVPIKFQVNTADRMELTTNGHLKIYGVADYPSDSAAAAGGVPVSGVYRTGSTLKIRAA